MTPETASVQLCAACGAAYSDLDRRSRCSCGGLLALRHATPGLSGDELRALFAARRSHPEGVFASGVWRYRELVLPNAGEAIVSHPEGNTPLLARDAVGRWAGVPGLLLKHEGHNPTGSFKDRGMTVGVTQAVRSGATAVACASTGNTAAALAAYAAQAGLPVLVVVPAGQVAAGKLAQSLAYGARTLLVRGDFDACLRLIEEAEDRLGVYLLNSINPYRLEGQKTIVFELLEQLGWQAPDWIALPAGNLGNTSAFGKALVEAHALGLIDRLPRLLAVQAAGAAPFARSFDEGFAERHKVQAETVATAIRIGDPASHDRAVQAIRATNGIVLALPDDAILEAKRVIDRSGVGCEPASAASVAGVRHLATRGLLHPGDRVVAVLTGHLLKDPGTHLPGAPQPLEIDADLRALERALES